MADIVFFLLSRQVDTFIGHCILALKKGLIYETENNAFTSSLFRVTSTNEYGRSTSKAPNL